MLPYTDDTLYCIHPKRQKRKEYHLNLEHRGLIVVICPLNKKANSNPATSHLGLQKSLKQQEIKKAIFKLEQAIKDNSQISLWKYSRTSIPFAFVLFSLISENLISYRKGQKKNSKKALDPLSFNSIPIYLAVLLEL